MMRTLAVVWLLCVLAVQDTAAVEPFTAGLGIGLSIIGSALLGSKSTIICLFSECCREPYLSGNVAGLRAELEGNVFGQHIVQDAVVKTLNAHVRNTSPKKALALSFHGMTGSGKNYVAKYIAEALFKEGTNSKFVHQFYSTVHFKNEAEVELYKTQLQDWIRGNVSLCARNLFIFDEIDKLPPGVIDAVKPYLDYHESIDSVDYRKSIFIFLSNTGGEDIAGKTMQHWRSGGKREELTYLDVEEALTLTAFNKLGGLQKADMIEKNLIDVFVPFLPLEKSHVKKCIRREYERQLENRRRQNLDRPETDQIVVGDYTEQDLDDLTEKMTYWPPGSKLFSTSGCKRVANLVSFALEEDF